jgi:hypothetical protein
MPNMIHVLILTSRRDFLQNSLKQDLNPGEGASPDSFSPFGPAVAELTIGGTERFVL